MSDNQHTHTEIPEIFIEQVKEALENLYDFAVLQHSPLAQACEKQTSEQNTLGAHWLRRKLIEAIETLNPGRDVTAHSGAARIYNLVYLHYVGGMTLQETALEVGVSLRQVYRDLRRGQEQVSAILWYSQERKDVPEAAPETTELSTIKTEISRLEGNVTTIPLQRMLESALRAVQKLADQRHITLDVQLPQTNVLITTNLAIAQQVLTYLLSQVIQQISPTHLRVSLEEHGGSIRIIFGYRGIPSAKPRMEPNIDQMIQQIHWKLQYRSASGEQQLIIRSVQEGALLLIIDDNQGLVELLRHYFTGNTYRVVSVTNGEQGLQMVDQLLPDVILLDLMMPGMDGWEVLQRLRTNSDTQDIPVVICSVINDPELAYSLGASTFVPKPVTKETLLNALRELHI